MQLVSACRSPNAYTLKSALVPKASRPNTEMGVAIWYTDPLSVASNAAAWTVSDHALNARAENLLVQALRKRFAALRCLEEGWDGYDAAKPDVATMTAAAAYLELALEGRPAVPLPSIVPIADGALQAEWYSSTYRFEIYFEADGDIAAWSENRATGVEMEAEGTDAIQLLVDWASEVQADNAEAA